MTDIDDVIRLLRDRRPEATELELDEIKQRVLRRAAQSPRRAQPMKSRLAILAMLVLGFVFSTAGVGMAVGGLSGSHSAAKSEYPSVHPFSTPTPTPPGKVLGEEENNNGQTTGLQPERQEENGSSGQLPFTGFAAIPVLLGGIALLSGGLVLRRRSREE
jgi:LPXTG-motif cell wall-anchored protein